MAETLFRQWFVEEAGEDWEEVAVGSVADVNLSSVGKEYGCSQIKYLDTGSLTEGKIDQYATHALGNAPSRAKRLVCHNDILISTVRPNQRHYGIIKNPPNNLVVSTGFCVLSCHSVDPHFLYLFLTSKDMTEYLHSVAEGSTSTYPSLKPSDIASLTFMRPPEELLNEFAALATNFWNKIEKNHGQALILENLRDELLPKLISGEVRVAQNG